MAVPQGTRAPLRHCRLDFVQKTVSLQQALDHLVSSNQTKTEEAEVVAFLSDFYAMFNLNTSKYLKYALKGVKLDVASQVGEKAKSEELVKAYKEYIDTDKSIYRELGLSAYYTYLKDKKKAVEHMRLFSKEVNVQYWIFLFLESDPLMSTMVGDPEFKEYFDEAQSKFWKMHNELKATLEEEELL